MGILIYNFENLCFLPLQLNTYIHGDQKNPLKVLIYNFENLCFLPLQLNTYIHGDQKNPLKAH